LSADFADERRLKNNSDLIDRECTLMDTNNFCILFRVHWRSLAVLFLFDLRRAPRCIGWNEQEGLLASCKDRGDNVGLSNTYLAKQGLTSM
jgi:hypothetical protein